MTPDQHLDAIAKESAALLRLAADRLEHHIDHLGSWLVRDLLAHVGAVYSVVISHVAAGAGEPASGGNDGPAPDGAAINDWIAERRSTLLAALAGDPDSPAQSHAGMQTAGWWCRRIASETAVHRWDVEAGIAGPAAAAPIASELATDAIAEYLEVGLRFSSSRPDRVYPNETLHLHRTDGSGEWMLATAADGSVLVTEEHGKGDAAVRGAASDLLVWLWGRPATGLEIFGDPAVAAAWQALAP